MVEHIGNTKCKSSDLTAEAFHLLKILFESLMDYNRAAMPQQAEEVHSCIRYCLDMYDSCTSDSVRIIYGGSVKPDNISDLMEKDNIDGGLLGGASLDPESFSKIVHFQ